AAEVAASSPLSGEPAGGRTTSPRPPADEPDEPPPADRPAAPDSVEGWRAVLADLYERRAAAFADARPEDLAGVYAPGSAPLAADERYARDLATAGEALRGFAPEITRLGVVASEPDRVQLDLVDRWADYEVVDAGAPDGPALRTVPGRPDTAVRMVLVRTGDGWRIESGRRVA
ncbi:MAG: hypothetical protein AVDCRST_MAG57-3469, partial [uncultured Blastococcus sp.]